MSRYRSHKSTGSGAKLRGARHLRRHQTFDNPEVRRPRQRHAQNATNLYLRAVCRFNPFKIHPKYQGGNHYWLRTLVGERSWTLELLILPQFAIERQHASIQHARVAQVAR